MSETSKNFAAAATLIVALAAAFGAMVHRRLASPGLHVECAIPDDLAVAAGTSVEIPFSVVNAGTTTNQVTGITVSCGCTGIRNQDGTVPEFPVSLPPGTRLDLTATTATRGTTGRIETAILIHCRSAIRYERDLRVGFAVLDGPRLVPSAIIWDPSADPPPVFWVGGPMDAKVSVAKVELTGVELDCSVHSELSPWDPTLQKPYAHWHPVLSGQLDVDSSGADRKRTGSGILSLWISTSADPLTAVIEIVDRSALSCSPRTIWIDGTGPTRRLLHLTGLAPGANLVATPADVTQVGEIRRGQFDQYVELQFETALLMRAEKSRSSERVVLEESISGDPTGRTIELTVLNGNGQTKSGIGTATPGK